MKLFNLKKVSTLIIITLLIVSCNKSENLSNLPPGPDTKQVNPTPEGGISAGGGGTLPAEPISVQRVFEIVDQAKKLLRLYINYERKYKDLVFYNNFYDGEENLATQLEKTDIEVMEEAPCKDKFGNEVDASVYGERTNTICLSAQRVASKLIEANAYQEILALLIHELSHFLGSNEEEATDLQRFSLFGLSKLSSDGFAMIEAVTWDDVHDYSFKRMFEKIDQAILDNNLHKLSENIRALHVALEKKGGTVGDTFRPLVYFDYLIGDYHNIMLAKLRLANSFINSLNLSSSDDELYQKCFGEQTLKKISEFSKECFIVHEEDNIYPDYAIKKINNPGELKKYLEDVYIYSIDLMDYIRAIAFNKPLPYFHLPTNLQEKNPWNSYLGKYELKLVNCSSEGEVGRWGLGDLIEIEIFETTKNYPLENMKTTYLREKMSNGSREDEIASGAGNNNTMKVFDNGQDGVVAEEENGNRWYDRQAHGWNKTTKTLKKMSDDEFIYTVKYDYFRYSSYNGAIQSTKECSYKAYKQ